VKVTKTPGELTVRSLTPATWDTAGRRITASFLYDATRSLFEEAGFSCSRPKGMNLRVLTATVAPAGCACGSAQQGISPGPTWSMRVQSRRAGELASAVAGLADDAGLPLMVDLRPDGVTIDSGKDQWEDGEGSATNQFVDLAGGIQTTARDFGLSADLTRPRFVQLGIDAVDVPAVRAFWASVLGYQHDPRTFLRARSADGSRPYVIWGRSPALCRTGSVEAFSGRFAQAAKRRVPGTRPR
jgi:hypothetical protein